MLKYVNYDIVFQEIPDETTLAINISNCPCHCEGCHSAYLAEDIGTPLNYYNLRKLLIKNKGLTCVAFMGGDSDPFRINTLAKWSRKLCGARIAWYSGRYELHPDIKLNNFDYIKLGPYIKERGPLTDRTTNQRLYKVVITRDIDENNNPIYGLEDITYKFWKDK